MAEIIKMNPDICTVSELLKRSSDLRGCLILGIDSEDAYFFGVANLSSKEVVYMIEKCKHFLLKMEE